MEELLQCGQLDGQGVDGGDAEDSNEEEDDLAHAQRQLLTPGKRFCLKLMSELFNSGTSGAVHHL